MRRLTDAAEDTGQRERGFPLAADDRDRLAGGALERRHEVRAVGGLAHGARGHDRHAFGARAPRARRVLRDRGGGARGRRLAEPAARGQPFAQPCHALVGLDHVPAAGADHVGDEQPHRVAAEVDGGEAHRRES